MLLPEDRHPELDQLPDFLQEVFEEQPRLKPVRSECYKSAMLIGMRLHNAGFKVEYCEGKVEFPGIEAVGGLKLTYEHAWIRVNGKHIDLYGNGAAPKLYTHRVDGLGNEDFEPCYWNGKWFCIPMGELADKPYRFSSWWGCPAYRMDWDPAEDWEPPEDWDEDYDDGPPEPWTEDEQKMMTDFKEKYLLEADAEGLRDLEVREISYANGGEVRVLREAA